MTETLSAENVKQSKKDVLALVIILAVVLGMTLFFTHYVRKIIEGHNITVLQEETIQSEKYLTNLFLSSRLSLQGMALLYERQMSSPKMSRNDLKIMQEHSLFDNLLFVDKKGVGIDASGKIRDVSDRDYYQRGINGESDVTVVFQSRFSGETIFVIFTPITYEDQVIGVLAGAHGEEWLTSILSRSDFYEESTSYLCLTDGRVFGSSKEGKVMPNIFDYYNDTKKISEEELENLKKCFNGQAESQLTYSIDDSEEIAFAILSERKVWVLVQKYPRSITKRMSATYSRNLLLTDSICIAIFLIYIVSVLSREMHRRNKLKASTEQAIRKKTMDLQDTLAILPAYYYKVLKINLAKDSYEIIKISEYDIETLPNKISLWVQKVAETGFVHQDDIKTYMDFYKPKEFIQKFNEGEQSLSCRYRRKSSEGFRWVKMEILPGSEYSPENPVVVLYILDINDDVVRENALQESFAAAEKANKAKSEFLSNMSHEIRTPMNAIIGMTAIAELHVADAVFIANYLQKLTDVSNHLMDLINEVLDMSKIESGKIELHEDEFSIASLIDNLVSMSHSLIESKHHDFTIVEQKIEHENVIGDSHRLQQALMNFLSNAIKYTPEGGKINFSVTERETNKKEISCFEFIIEDNGIGMSKEYQKHLFEPFTRADDTRVNTVQGTGLGMSITKNIIQMMNGNIQVQSELNKGTKFIVTIFLRLPKEQNDTHIVKNRNFSLKEFEKEDFSGKRVLLVDDNDINREITTEILKLAKLEIESAANGQEALETFKTAPKDYFNIIFMDVQMPVMNGYEATRAIRALPESKYNSKIPIIVLTANAFSDDVVNAVNAGANGHIAKPLNFEILLNTLKEWLE